MPRALPEWIGKTADTAVPPRVRLRVFDKYDGRCQCGCNRKIRPGEAWDLEDTKAIINGGENRESNKKPWLAAHHKDKTAADVAEKSKVYRKRAKHVGVSPRSKIASRGFPKPEPQRTASRPIRRKEFEEQP
jgi:5-methylcytosine-specific restriction protein A